MILEIQQRHDVGTFRRHYCHAQEEEITRALDHASVPVTLQSPPAEEREANLSPEPAANAPLPVAGPTAHPAMSRNAWRKQKRKDGKKAWKASQASD